MSTSDNKSNELAQGVASAIPICVSGDADSANTLSRLKTQSFSISELMLFTTFVAVLLAVVMRWPITGMFVFVFFLGALVRMLNARAYRMRQGLGVSVSQQAIWFLEAFSLILTLVGLVLIGFFSLMMLVGCCLASLVYLFSDPLSTLVPLGTLCLLVVLLPVLQLLTKMTVQRLNDDW